MAQTCARPPARRVRDVMVRTPLLVHPDHPLREALHRMREARLHFAPVVDGDEIVGVVSTGSLAAARRGGAQDHDVTSVRDVMTNEFPFLYEYDGVAFAAALVRATGAAHFCVVDAERRLTGILSLKGPAAAELPGAAAADPHTVGTRVAVHPARATSAQPGDPGSYADAPTLYIKSESLPTNGGPIDARAHPEDDEEAQRTSHLPPDAQGSR